MEHKSAKNDQKCDQDQWEKKSKGVQMVDNGNKDEGEVVTNTEEEDKSDAAVSKDGVKKGTKESSNSGGMFSFWRAKIASATEEKEEKKMEKERKKSDDKCASLDSKLKSYTEDETDSDNDVKGKFKCVVRSNSSTIYVANDPDGNDDKDTAQKAKDKDEEQEEANVDIEEDENKTDHEQGKSKDKPAEESSEQTEGKDAIKSIKQ